MEETDTVSRCVVGGCQFNPESGVDEPELDDTIKFYKFPKCASRHTAGGIQRDKWVEFVRISLGHDPKSPTSWTPSPNDKICNGHFVRMCKSDNSGKSNFAPTIFPEGLRDAPPRIIYELKDLVCWWIKEGETRFPHMHPIVEADPIPSKPSKKPPKPDEKQEPRTIKSFTLVEMDINSEPHPIVKTYIRVQKDLTFEACLKNTPVPAHSILGDDGEKICLLGSVHEFQCALERLMNLNLCIGISTAGLSMFPPAMNGSVAKIVVNGKETERLVSNKCEVVAGIKVCVECKKLWNWVYNAKFRSKKNYEKVEVAPPEETNLSVEERLQKCERIIENYKVEVCRLHGKNKELRDRILVLKEALRQEVGENIDGGGGGAVGKRKRSVNVGGGDSDVEVVDDVQLGEVGGKRPRNATLDNCASGHTNQLTPAKSPASTPANNTSLPEVAPPPKTTPPRQKQPVTNPKVTSTESLPVKTTTTTPGQPSQKPTPKVLKITREQALLLRKFTSTNQSGNVIRVHASQVASINKILGRPSTPNSPQLPQTAPVNTDVEKIQVPSTGQVVKVVDNRKRSSGECENEDGSSATAQGEETAKKVITVTVVKK